jgi:hypothetical protein
VRALFETIIKTSAVVLVVSFLQMTASLAAPVVYLSSSGDNNNPCTAALPCATPYGAEFGLDAAGGSELCVGPAAGIVEITFGTNRPNFVFDCAGTLVPTGVGFPGFGFYGSNQVVKIRNATITGLSGGYPAISWTGSGSLVLENCVLENIGTGPALDIEPNGQLNLVIKYSRISNSAAGVLLKPAAGGSIKATFDHVTITNNAGGGIKADSTNGVINLDVTDGEISNNGGNGVNAVAGASQNIVSLKNSVIARNGAAGVQANGVNAGMLIATTLFDQNAAGATSVVGGGNMFTYGNNQIVGSIGSGFNQTAQLH